LTQADLPDFGFHHPFDTVLTVYYGMKDQHLPKPGGMLDQPAKLIADVQKLNYIMTIVRHILQAENKTTAPDPWDDPNTINVGNMFDGT